MRDLLHLVRSNGLLAAAALVSVVFFRLTLWVLPFRWLHRFSSSRTALLHLRNGGDLARRRRVAHAITVVSRCVPGASCLTQALAAQTLLRLCGEYAELCYGATCSPQGTFEAHAWLESGDHIVIGALPNLSSYRRFTPLASRA